jgi:hypothetical protein
MKEYLSPSECVYGYTYRISARNFRIGVYVGGDKGGFIGLREKFFREFLFTEYHWDLGGNWGTVQPIEVIEICPVSPLEEDSTELFDYLRAREADEGWAQCQKERRTYI